MKDSVNKSPSSCKLRAASRSMTVWFSALVPVLLAAAEAFKEQLPAMSSVLSGWGLVLASVAVSAIIAALRVRNEGVESNESVESNFDGVDGGGVGGCDCKQGGVE